MVDKKDIKQNLQQLGLTEEECQVYIELLYSDALSAYELSRNINIPRTTVYRICQSLVDKNFAEWIVEENSKKIKAVRPASFKFLIDEQQHKLEQVQSSVTSLESMVKDLVRNVPKTEVRYYQGAEGMKQMIWNCLKADKYIYGWSVYGRREVVGEKFNLKYVEEFNLKKLRDRSIANEDSLPYLKKYLKPNVHQQDYGDIRFISKKKFYIAGDTSIYNNVYAVAFWKEGEIVGVEIENPELVKIQKSIFEILWNIAEPVEKYLK